jgi:hypothetical protein
VCVGRWIFSSSTFYGESYRKEVWSLSLKSKCASFLEIFPTLRQFNFIKLAGVAKKQLENQPVHWEGISFHLHPFSQPRQLKAKDG